MQFFFVPKMSTTCDVLRTSATHTLNYELRLSSLDYDKVNNEMFISVNMSIFRKNNFNYIYLFVTPNYIYLYVIPNNRL